MTSKNRNVQDGRVWIQTKKFTAYDLLAPYGFSDATDPVGSVTQVREANPSRRRSSIVTDVVRSEPGLYPFTITTRLRSTLNYMLGLGKRISNFQVHFGDCERPDVYSEAKELYLWERCHRGDLSAGALTQISGDDSPIEISVPFNAELGFVPVDLSQSFLSQRTLVDTGAVNAIAPIIDDCDDISSQTYPGDVAYAFTDAGYMSTAVVWYTTDRGNTWTSATSQPFAASENILGGIVLGSPTSHRLFAFRNADGSNPAEIAYADVTIAGTLSWNLVEVGSVNGQYVTAMHAVSLNRVYAVTNDGYIYKSTNGGVTWTLKDSSSGVALNSISSLVDGTVCAVGASNTIMFSEDNGATWTSLAGPTAGSGDANTAVVITEDGTLFVGNDAGELYGSYDDGVNWTTLSIQGVTATAVDSLAAFGNQIIWLVVTTASGGKVLKSTDGGATFRVWSLATPANSGLNHVALVDQNFVYISGEPHNSMGFISLTTSNLIGVDSIGS